jgi:hypothetical protein
VSNIGLKSQDHPLPYPLKWVNKDVELKVIKQCKINFFISENYINEVEVDVVPFYVCVVLIRIPYMYMRDVIFMRKENQYLCTKDGKSFIINEHKDKYMISLVSANQPKKLISTSRKFVFLFIR